MAGKTPEDRQRLRELLAELRPHFADVLSARRNFELAQEYGLHVTPNHFYYPIPDTSVLPPAIWNRRSEMPGVNMDDANQLDLLETVFSRYREDFAAFPLKKTGNELEFSFENDQISGADPFILHALIREMRPGRVVEVGGGYSSLASAKALRQNGAGELVCIEPYPRSFLPRALEGIGTLIREPVQQVGLDVFTSLGKSDILFIDSTHVVRMGGDVNHLFLEVLPRLAPGVWVQVHDVFFPCDYPEPWTRDMNFFWSEQYLLQAFLIGNRMFRTRFAVGYMGRRYPDAMSRVFPGWALGMGGGSFWMSREEGP
jgi:hypothetical protein